MTVATLIGPYCEFKELNIGNAKHVINKLKNKIEGVITNEIFAGSNIFRTIVHPEPIIGVTRKIECAVSVNAKEFQEFFMERFLRLE